MDREESLQKVKFAGSSCDQSSSGELSARQVGESTLDLVAHGGAERASDLIAIAL